MKLKFDINQLEKEILAVAKAKKTKLNCPKCKLYCGEYSLNDIDNTEIYCDNCDTLVIFNVTYKNEK